MTSPVVDWSLLDPYVLAAIIALHGTLAVLFRLVYGSRLAPSLAQAPGQASRTLLADMLAYDSVAVCYAIFTLYVGATSWFGWCDPADAASAVGGSMHDRLYGRSERFMLLGVATACYEAYNVVVVVACIPEYRTPIHLTHHATTCFLALFGGYPFLQYYGFFFFVFVVVVAAVAGGLIKSMIECWAVFGCCCCCRCCCCCCCCCWPIRSVPSSSSSIVPVLS